MTEPKCEDCGRSDLFARKRCNPCYTRLKRRLKKTGEFEPLRLEGTTEERLWAAIAITPSGCFLRTTGIDSDGYGLIRDGGKTRRAHRVAYELAIGEIPNGLQLDHLCHTRDAHCPGGTKCLHRRCVNPEHLEPVTTQENSARGGNVRRSKCSNGHDYDTHSYVSSRGSRGCRRCDAEATRRYKQRKAKSSAA